MFGSYSTLGDCCWFWMHLVLECLGVVLWFWMGLPYTVLCSFLGGFILRQEQTWHAKEFMHLKRPETALIHRIKLVNWWLFNWPLHLPTRYLSSTVPSTTQTPAELGHTGSSSQHRSRGNSSCLCAMASGRLKVSVAQAAPMADWGGPPRSATVVRILSSSSWDIMSPCGWATTATTTLWPCPQCIFNDSSMPYTAQLDLRLSCHSTCSFSMVRSKKSFKKSFKILYIYLSIFNNLDLVFPHLWLKMAARYRQMLADDRSRRIGWQFFKFRSYI